MSNDAKVYVKMITYCIVTFLITFASLVEGMDLEHIQTISIGIWIKTLIKAFATSLISLKAFLDTSLNDSKIEINKDNHLE